MPSYEITDGMTIEMDEGEIEDGLVRTSGACLVRAGQRWAAVQVDPDGNQVWVPATADAPRAFFGGTGRRALERAAEAAVARGLSYASPAEYVDALRARYVESDEARREREAREEAEEDAAYALSPAEEAQVADLEVQERRGRGRPRVASEDRRTRASAIVVPCSERERARYDATARALGVPLSELVRALLDREG